MNEEKRHDQEERGEYVPPAFRHRAGAVHGAAPPAPPPLNPISRIEFERVFGGRVLAWIGGLATLLGVFFLMRSAVDSSWFTEEVRVLIDRLAGEVSVERAVEIIASGAEPLRELIGAMHSRMLREELRRRREDAA